MPRKEGKIQLNLSVDSWVKEVLKQTFENEGLSLAQGITKIAKHLENNGFKLTCSIVTENYQSNPRTTSTVLDTSAITSTVLDKCREEIKTQTNEEASELAKKFDAMSDRLTQLEKISDPSIDKSNDVFLKELDRRDERLNELNTELLKRVTNLESNISTMKDLVTQDQLAELKDTIAANQNAIAQIQQNKQLKLDFESTQLDKTPATTAAPEQKTKGNSPDKGEASPCENEISQKNEEMPEKNSSTPQLGTDKSTQSKSLLSKQEAYQLARDRGYKSSTNAFSQVFVDAKKLGKKDKKLFGICKASEKGKYIDMGWSDNEI